MKVLIADDHALFRDGLSLQLEQIDAAAEIRHAGTFTQALQYASEETFDLIILDLDMPDMAWEEAIKAFKEKCGQTRFVVVSATEDIRSIRKALEYGASGYIPKRSETQVIRIALKLVLNGGTYLPPMLLEETSVSSTPIPSVKTTPEAHKKLTARQREVLGYIAQGMSNKQIAYEMGVSEATVKLHINALLKVIGATNRTQAVILAQKSGLI